MTQELNEFIYDASVERQIYLLRHRAGLVRKIKQVLKKHDVEFTDALASRLARLSGKDIERLGTAIGFTTAQLQALEALLERFQETSFQTLNSVLDEELNQLTEDEYDFQREVYLNGVQGLGLVSGVALASKMSDPSGKRKLELSVGKTQDEIISEWAARRKQKVLATIRLAVTTNENPDINTILKAVGGTSRRFGGILRDTHYGAIVYSETLHQSAISAGAMDIVRQFSSEEKENSETINQADLLWSSILDGKTSSKCFRLHNKLVFKQLGGQRPPAHPRCRSNVIPWYGGNASSPNSETVTKWFRRQPEDVKKRILGKNRYEAYSKDSSSLSFPRDFISENGDRYTLEQLRSRNKI